MFKDIYSLDIVKDEDDCVLFCLQGAQEVSKLASEIRRTLNSPNQPINQPTTRHVPTKVETQLRKNTFDRQAYV